MLLTAVANLSLLTDPCLSSPCMNDGTCVNQGDGTFKCECPNTCICADMGPLCERGNDPLLDAQVNCRIP